MKNKQSQPIPLDKHCITHCNDHFLLFIQYTSRRSFYNTTNNIYHYLCMSVSLTFSPQLSIDISTTFIQRPWLQDHMVFPQEIQLITTAQEGNPFAAMPQLCCSIHKRPSVHAREQEQFLFISCDNSPFCWTYVIKWVGFE